jgi:hypothetical protein
MAGNLENTKNDFSEIGNDHICDHEKASLQIDLFRVTNVQMGLRVATFYFGLRV